ncbi:hypothetical protein [Halorussus caseinilyticus]|uniref:Uncharacterized protein n=1 Tax=Halorussus caseinilyticus TaxID=3034025 RepID=A0ABD5WTC4_9EURY
MGEFADAVRDRLRDALAERRPSLDWETEYRVRRTPVDVVGTSPDRFVTVEVEWRRADPVNNTAKLFYYADEGEVDEYDEVVVCQLFSGYYDLASGGVSSKREVAEFVGETAAESVEHVSFHPCGFQSTRRSAAVTGRRDGACGPTKRPPKSGRFSDSLAGVRSLRAEEEPESETVDQSVRERERQRVGHADPEQRERPADAEAVEQRWHAEREQEAENEHREDHLDPPVVRARGGRARPDPQVPGEETRNDDGDERGREVEGDGGPGGPKVPRDREKSEQEDVRAGNRPLKTADESGSARGHVRGSARPGKTVSAI